MKNQNSPTHNNRCLRQSFPFLVALPLAGLLAFLMPATTVLAQEEAPPGEAEETVELQEFTVTGSRITRFETEATTLPLSVITSETLEGEGFVSSGEIFSELVFTGSAEFEESQDGPNDARGDVTSISLRGVGSAFTLVLLDGRRLAPHPLDQTIGFKPSLLVNANVIPAGMIDHIDILRDGASAIYGTDASAGVVNTILERDYTGHSLRIRYGWAQQGDFDETLITYKGGFNFNENRTNVSVFFSYFDRPNIANTDRPYAFPIDHRPQLPDRFNHPDETSPRNVSSNGPWTNATPLDPENSFPVHLDLGTAGVKTGNLTRSNGQFHTQPTNTNRTGTRIEHQPANNAGIDDRTKSGSLGTGDFFHPFDGTRLSERFDFGLFTDLTSAAERKTFATSFNHRTKNGKLTFFGDLSYYKAETRQNRAPTTIPQSAALIVPKDNYWNPFGSIASPNRISVANGFGTEVIFASGKAVIPDEGIEVLILGYRTVDFEPRVVSVKNESILGTFGVRGTLWEDWNWETGFRYNRNETSDTETGRISKTGFASILNKTTPDALNVFGGPGVNELENLAPATIAVTRVGVTELATWDISLSNSDVMKFFGNPLGASVGAELRLESYSDDRDPHIDGTITFNDTVNGRSDVTGVSFTPDRSNERSVYAIYGELLLPIVGEANRLPFVHRLEAHVAGRFEDFDDFGSVSKPKISGTWYPTKDILLRVSFAEGFRAPNLSVLSAPTQRTNSGIEDTYRVEFDDENPRNDGSFSITDLRTGAEFLTPEESETLTAGIVMRIPKLKLTLIADFWSIKITDLITRNSSQDLVDDEAEFLNTLSFQDFINDGQGVGDIASRGIPLVERRAVAQVDFDLAQDKGHYPVGDIDLINTSMRNEQLREVTGWDLGVEWILPETFLGRFTLSSNVTYLVDFDEQEIVGDPVTTEVRDERNPRVRASGSIYWRKGNASASLSANWISDVIDNDIDARFFEEDLTPEQIAAGIEDGDQTGEEFLIDEFLRFNTRVSYAFDEGFLKGTRLTFGVRNIGNEDPPFSPDQSRGYKTNLHSNRGRFYYTEIRYDF